MWIVDKKQKQGITIYTVQNEIGQTMTYSADFLKGSMRDGSIVIENAKLTPSGRIYISKEQNAPKINKNKGVGEYKRTKEIQNMTKRQKVDYYWNVLIKRDNIGTALINYTIDELECVLEGSLALEIGDQGSSSVDITLVHNIYSYPSITAVLKEVQRRGYLTEKECKDYLVGMDNKGRICNQYTFAEWIMKRKKKK